MALSLVLRNKRVTNELNIQRSLMNEFITLHESASDLKERFTNQVLDLEVLQKNPEPTSSDLVNAMIQQNSEIIRMISRFIYDEGDRHENEESD